jgi:signal transduction histidine kinase
LTGRLLAPIDAVIDVISAPLEYQHQAMQYRPPLKLLLSGGPVHETEQQLQQETTIAKRATAIGTATTTTKMSLAMRNDTEVEVVFLTDVLPPIIAATGAKCEEEGISFRLNNTKRNRWSELPGARVNVFSLTEALTNVIDNAIKYGGKGRITLDVDSTDTHLCIAVEDNGDGVEESLREGLFIRGNRGSRGEVTRGVRRNSIISSGRGGDQQGGKGKGDGLSFNSEGSGLGLYIARNLMRKMGGDVVMQSGRRSKGARCCIYLPRPLGGKGRVAMKSKRAEEPPPLPPVTFR